MEPKNPPVNELYFNREKLVRVFFFVAFAFILYQLFLLAKPFLTALLMAMMLAMAFFPLYLRLRRHVVNANLAALMFTFLVFLSAAVPLIWLIFFVFREAERLLPTVQSILLDLQAMNVMALKERIPDLLLPHMEPIFNFLNSWEFDLEKIALRYANMVGTKITSLGAFLAKNALVMAINVVVFLMAVFFAFRDGEVLLQWFLTLVPMQSAHKKALAKRAYETFMAVVMGVILTASAQGLVAMIGFFIAGVKLPVMLGMATMVTSFFGASFLITIPVAVLLFQTSFWKGMFLLLWGAILVGWMDNFLKPFLIGTRARMPFVLIFFSIIGGVKAYGLLGFILGPVIVASFLTFVSFYRRSLELKTMPQNRRHDDSMDDDEDL